MVRSMIRPTVLCIMALITLLSCSNGGAGGNAGALPTPLSERFAIDGVVDLAAVGSVQQQTINIMDSFGTSMVVKTMTLQWAAANDDRNFSSRV